MEDNKMLYPEITSLLKELREANDKFTVTSQEAETTQQQEQLDTQAQEMSELKSRVAGMVRAVSERGDWETDERSWLYMVSDAGVELQRCCDSFDKGWLQEG